MKLGPLKVVKVNKTYHRQCWYHNVGAMTESPSKIHVNGLKSTGSTVRTIKNERYIQKKSYNGRKSKAGFPSLLGMSQDAEVAESSLDVSLHCARAYKLNVEDKRDYNFFEAFSII